MAKPDTLPEWDTTEVNLTEADIAHKEQGHIFTAGVPEKPPADFSNWYQNLVYKWILHLSQSKVYTHYITSQVEFDTVFDGSTISDTTIYMLQGNYTLNNQIPVGSNVLIDSDPGTIITRGSGTDGFLLQGTALSYIENVQFTRNWELNGNAIVTSVSIIGLDYVKNSIFHCYVTNVVKNTGSGGAYNDSNGFSFGLSIENISNCQAPSGGAVSGLSQGFISPTVPDVSSSIKNIYDCSATSGGGGGCNNIRFCRIENIYNCSAPGNGGGLSSVQFCNIKNIYSNTATLAGGGISTAFYCVIDQIYNNEAGTFGGGISSADFCAISNIRGNDAIANSGGGLSNCNSCTIINVFNNTSQTTGGGLHTCDFCKISNVAFNTATTGAAHAIALSTNCSISQVNNNGAGNLNYAIDLCPDSNISLVYGNSCGGVSNSNNCTLIDIYSNNTSSGGGGADTCTDIVALGNWQANIGTPNNTINNSSGLTLLIQTPGLQNFNSTNVALNF
jgi:hypothetical protein